MMTPRSARAWQPKALPPLPQSRACPPLLLALTLAMTSAAMFLLVSHAMAGSNHDAVHAAALHAAFRSPVEIPRFVTESDRRRTTQQRDFIHHLIVDALPADKAELNPKGTRKARVEETRARRKRPEPATSASAKGPPRWQLNGSEWQFKEGERPTAARAAGTAAAAKPTLDWTPRLDAKAAAAPGWGAGVACGKHRAAECRLCPSGQGADWCNGECEWRDNACGARAPSAADDAAPTGPTSTSYRCEGCAYVKSLRARVDVSYAQRESNSQSPAAARAAC
jgi:hypothetical protein